jgi:hypothetical protein
MLLADIFGFGGCKELVKVKKTRSFVVAVGNCSPETTNFSNFFRLYKVVVHPLIWQYWEENRAMVLATADEEDVKLTGGGQYDSPGHMAKFLFYRYENIGYRIRSKKKSKLQWAEWGGGGAGAGEIIFLRVPNSLEECDGWGGEGKYYLTSVVQWEDIRPGGPSSALKETVNLYFLAVEYEAAMGRGALSAPFGVAKRQNDGCAQRTGAHARPKPTR